MIREKVLGVMLAVGLGLASYAFAQPSIEGDATDWFTNSYWPHWSSSRDLDVAGVKRFFSKDYRYFTEDAEPYVGEFPPPEFLTLLNEMQADGWIGDEILDVNATYMNSRTVAIDNHFVSRFENGKSIEFCMWYLLHEYESDWRITTVVWQDCPTPN